MRPIGGACHDLRQTASCGTVRGMMCEIVNCSSRDLIGKAMARDLRFQLVHADPPWTYGGAGRPKHGRADTHYAGMKPAEIVEDLDRAYDVATIDAYLVVWVTWPILFEFVEAIVHATDYEGGLDVGAPSFRWQPLTGGTWGKRNGRGIGFHVIGDSEPLLIFRKGLPRPRGGPRSNLWETGEDEPGAHWSEKRTAMHSEKPVAILMDIVRSFSDRNGHVLELYAGESASMARACVNTERGYLGAEIDSKRWATACSILETVTE